MSVKARMVVESNVGDDQQRQVSLRAVYSPDPESPNYSFSKWTPSGQLNLTITNPAAFEQFETGKVFDLTFTEYVEPVPVEEGEAPIPAPLDGGLCHESETPAQVPTVGRIVHFYSDVVASRDGTLTRGYNGMGEGPYAAMVTQVSKNADGEVSFINLKVFPPFGEAFDEGSVPTKAVSSHRYWEWPPRD